jgi:tetraacyldisaccharide 4'-kinase
MNFWYTSKIKWPSALLFPFSLLVRAISSKRRATRNRTPYKVPLIIIGNLTVGGTGKTPMIIWLVHLLQNQGFKVGVVSRGYGAKPKPEYPYLVDKQSPASLAGDEPKLIQSRTGCVVVVDPQRHRAVQFLTSNWNVDIVISDDGMQHYAMYRDLEILMVDGHRLFGNGLLLPAGPLREPIQRLKTVDFIVSKGQPTKQLTGAFVAAMVFCQPVNFAGQTINAGKVRAASGIGNFGSFIHSLEQLGFTVVEKAQFQDHQKLDEHSLTETEYPVIITEKDAVKLDLSNFPNTYVLKLDYSLPEVFEHQLINKIEALIE